MTALDGFIAGLPKAELHMHLEGSLEPALMLALAKRNGVELPYATVEAAEAAYDFDELQDFLDLYYRGTSVLRTAEDFHDLTWAYLERVRRDNAIHVELFFDPQAHTARGVAFVTVIGGIESALLAARRQCGITSRLILCFLRHLSEAEGFATLEAALPFRDRIAGVGLDSSERGHPPSKFARLFRKAGELGFLRVAHAGEEGPPDYVREAVDLLGIDRLDHGNRALEDPALVERLRKMQMTFTVCPLSNLRLKGVARLEDHPLRRMLEAGLRVTVNSDDPAYFGGYLGENYRAIARALGLDRAALATLARNSFLGSFMTPEERSAALGRLDAYLATAG
ncbi:MAG: adenosine deaminase [Hyphomicrobium sp.]|uniref:adenosine deaminase n=1 Tax=Hyphomicrobium sp. TaxID=82 RepID=UPI003D0A38FF